MSKSKYLTGTPWHVECMTRQEGDPKRHKSRCIYYIAKSKSCERRNGICIGSAHCMDYKEKIHEAIQDENIISTNLIKHFDGIKEIPIELIAVKHSKIKKPKQEKVDTLIEYYRNNGRLDKPIIVSIQDDSYLLEDKYLRYYVAKKLGLKTILAKMGTLQESKNEDKLRKIGMKIVHKTYGKGTVIDANEAYTTVRFENGKEVKLGIFTCIENKLISFL